MMYNMAAMRWGGRNQPVYLPSYYSAFASPTTQPADYHREERTRITHMRDTVNKGLTEQ